MWQRWSKSSLAPLTESCLPRVGMWQRWLVWAALCMASVRGGCKEPGCILIDGVEVRRWRERDEW